MFAFGLGVLLVTCVRGDDAAGKSRTDCTRFARCTASDPMYLTQLATVTAPHHLSS